MAIKHTLAICLLTIQFLKWLFPKIHSKLKFCLRNSGKTFNTCMARDHRYGRVDNLCNVLETHDIWRFVKKTGIIFPRFLVIYINYSRYLID